MKQEGLLFFSDTYLLWIGFFLFFFSFLFLVIKLFMKNKTEFYNVMAKLPLEEESSNEQ